MPVGTPYALVATDGYDPYFPERNFVISGVTKDQFGAALPSCSVYLINQATNIAEQSQTSDASGNFSFTVDKTATYRVYSTNGTVSGVTLNTLTGV